MPKYRHKPTTIDARRIKQRSFVFGDGKGPDAEVGDWLVWDINGVPYRLTDEMFRQLYEPVDEEAAQHMREPLVQ